MNDILRDKLEKLPDEPGCYLMKDEQGNIIYVGKAVNLKNRVRSYFRGSHDPKTERLVEHIADFDTVIVGSETEALILESNLIKEHSPHYNILMRDDKHYPYLRLTMNEDFPRLLVARRAKNDGSRYFGPYPSVGGIHHVIELIRDAFPLRSCGGATFRPGQRACLNGHIGRCKAPCAGQISKDEYAVIVEEVSLFLQGKSKDLIRREQEAMGKAADELRFEDAARHRDRLRIYQQLQVRQELDQGTGEGDYDLLAVTAGEDQAVVQIFFVRRGNVVSREHFFLTNSGTGMDALLMQRFILEYYGGGELLPRQICCNVLPEQAEMVAQALSKSSGHRVEFIVPQRGAKKRLLDLTKANAQLILDNYLRSRQRQELISSKALEDLRLALHMDRTPRRIECYDISHVQGRYMVGSMVVFINGAPAPKLYRRFKIKTLTESNDFAALQEVIERRYRRGLDEREQGKEPLDFGDFPDLLVIDGGKGQLSAVCERLDDMAVQFPAIISLAKQEEEIFFPGRSEPMRLPYESDSLQLLQRLRDEAHRFAITFHRQLRGKGQVSSALDEVPGIGAERKKALLKTFGSLKRIREAGEEELAAAPKMNRSAAASLYEYLHSGDAEGKGEESNA
ncbi:MAG: excinuclease ABC subunit UvrC [Bacillota bacterium]|nr:excinuclease ABC subunit UvrC [Bacillota bacterium]